MRLTILASVCVALLAASPARARIPIMLAGCAFNHAVKACTTIVKEMQAGRWSRSDQWCKKNGASTMARTSGACLRLADIYYQRGVGYVRMKDYPRALADFSASLHHYRTGRGYGSGIGAAGPSGTYLARGDVYRALGQRAKAIADYRAVLKLSPNSRPAMARLKALGVKP